MFEALRIKMSLLFSSTNRPLSPASSNRLVPGASPVELMHAPGAQLVHSGENHVWISLVSGDEAFGVGFVRGDRLFHHGMNSRVERGDAQRGVLKVRRGDDDSVHLAGPDELFAVGEGF